MSAGSVTGWEKRSRVTLLYVARKARRDLLAALCSLGWSALFGGLVVSCAPTSLPGPSAVALLSRKEQGPAPGEPLPPALDRIVDYCEIGSIEQGREFRVLAIYLSGFETSDLIDRRDCLPAQFWVEFSPAAAQASNNGTLRKIRLGAATVVVFRGSYRCGAAYGHLGSYNCQFTVSAVERVLGEIAWP